MNIVIDALLLCLLLGCTVWGLKKGFIKSLLGFIGYLLAAFLSSALSGVLAAFVYQTFLHGVFLEKVSSVLTETAAATAAEQAQALLDSLPGFLSNALVNSGMTQDSLEATLAGSAQELAPVIVNALSPSVINLLRILFMILLFAVFMFLIRILVRMIASVFRLPVLRQVNALLGGAFGLFSGAIFAALLIVLVSWAAPLMPEDTAAAWQNGAQNSIAVQTMSKFFPLVSWFGEPF